MGRLYNILHAIAQRACIETGTSDNWKYKKYADGTFEAWYTGSITTAVSTAWYGLYHSSSAIAINYPSFVTSIEYSSATLVRSSAAVWTHTISDSGDHISFFGVAPTAYNNATYSARVYIKGTWA